jgi:hypothetical protein
MNVTIKFYSQFMGKEQFNGEEPEEPFFGIIFNAKKEGRKILPLAAAKAATKTNRSRVELIKMLKKDCGLSGELTQWLWFVIAGTVENEKKGISSGLTAGGVCKMEALPPDQLEWFLSKEASHG